MNYFDSIKFIFKSLAVEKKKVRPFYIVELLSVNKPLRWKFMKKKKFAQKIEKYVKFNRPKGFLI